MQHLTPAELVILERLERARTSGKAHETHNYADLRTLLTTVSELRAEVENLKYTIRLLNPIITDADFTRELDSIGKSASIARAAVSDE